MNLRNFDNWNSYLDLESNLLHGKVQFVLKGTTSYKTIYDRDGQPLSNPIYTDALGRTSSQVFLDTDNYTALFYKYIGTGDMTQWDIEDFDPSRWAIQYTSDNVRISDATITAKSADSCSSLKSMVDTDPETVSYVDGVRYMRVLGYYEAGDAPEAVYIWDEDSTLPEDGGSVIRSSVATKGRWLLCPTGELHFDVRHFGIMAQTDEGSTDYTYTSQLANCATYINAYGLDAFFPQIKSELSYYLFDGTNTFSIYGDIYFADRVRLSAKTGTNTTVISCNEIHKVSPYLISNQLQTGKITLSAKEIPTSFFDSWAPEGATYGYVIDTAEGHFVFADTHVTVECTPTSDVSFDNCTVDSNKMLSNKVTITNGTQFDTDWFADDFDYDHDLLISSTVVNLSDCKDADTYVKVKTLMNDANYGSCGEQELHDAEILAGGTLEDCSGTVTVITNSKGTLELHNASVTISGLTSNNSINAVDSWITVSGATVIDSLNMRRGSVATSVSLQVLSSLYLQDADVPATLSLFGLSGMEFQCCRISGNIGIVGHNNFVFNNCTFQSGSAVSYVGDATTIYGTWKDCLFQSGSNGIAVSSNKEDTDVSCSWIGNHSDMESHFITLDRTNFKEYNTMHHYIYKDNTGANTLQSEVSIPTYGSVINGIDTALTDEDMVYLAAIRGGDDYELWEGVWWLAIGLQNTDTGADKGKQLTATMFSVGEKSYAILDPQMSPYSSTTGLPTGDCHIVINDHNMTPWTQPTYDALLTLKSGYQFRVATGSAYAFHCLGRGDLSGTPISRQQLHWNIVIKLQQH